MKRLGGIEMSVARRGETVSTGETNETNYFCLVFSRLRWVGGLVVKGLRFLPPITFKPQTLRNLVSTTCRPSLVKAHNRERMRGTSPGRRLER